MRYSSLLNSKKWSSANDTSKGSGTPTFWPSHSVKLFYLLTNHPFSNLVFSGPNKHFNLKFGLVVSKWPKFNNWPTFSWNVTDLIHLRPHETLCCFVAFWVVLGSTNGAQHFGLPHNHLPEYRDLPYLIWKRGVRSFIWAQKQQLVISDFND